LVVNRALEKIDLELENRDLRKQIAADGQFGRLLGKSSRMQQLFATADQVAATDVTVLIMGRAERAKSCWRAKFTIAARARKLRLSR
jgi:DNA-binding NtrC family response regulator